MVDFLGELLGEVEQISDSEDESLLIHSRGFLKDYGLKRLTSI